MLTIIYLFDFVLDFGIDIYTVNSKHMFSWINGDDLFYIYLIQYMYRYFKKSDLGNAMNATVTTLILFVGHANTIYWCSDPENQ